MKNEQIINSYQSLEAYKKYLDTQFEQFKYLRMNLNTGKQYTGQQRKAIHVFFELASKELNDNGVDCRAFFREGFSLRWTPEFFKENVWRPIQKAMFHKKSTTQLERKEIDEIYDPINLKLAEFGIFVPFPHKKEKDEK